MRVLSSIVIGVLAATAVSCASPNPDFCCVTPDTCAAAGLVDERRPCGVGQACNAYECVAAECTTSADCTSPEAPTCLAGLCVAGCTVDDDCAGVAGRPRCDPGAATCVGCTSSDHCTADKAICDADTQSCRGCTADDQCASGVCIEATGICAADDAIIYVTETGTDTGTCPRVAPCKTMSFAMGRTSSVRNVIRILGGYFHLGNGSVYLAGSVILDGSNTTLTSGFSPAITSGGPAVLEGVRLSSTNAFTPLLKVATGGSLTLAQATIDDGQIEVVAGGMLNAMNLRSRNSNIECENGGTLTMKASHLEGGFFDSACKLVLSGNRLEPAPGQPSSTIFQGSSQLIENNVFIGAGEETVLIVINGASGSTFRFNTIVNTSPLTGSVIAIACEEGVNVTSNIIAYNSTSPILCVARYSLFDMAGAQEINRGVGNRSADMATFFVDRQAGDLHLSPSSPARGFGEPGLIAADLDGNARPMPFGSLPDVGAYEAP